jgi:hypothetical protein
MASDFISLPPSGGAGGVDSFNARTGAVVPLAPDYSAFYLSLDGSAPMAGDLDMDSNSITNLANGVDPGDAVNKGQLDGKQATITGAASTVVSADLTIDRAVISNGSGKLAVSAVTSTELGYVSGVTSALQTQLNAKGDVSGPASSTNLAIPKFSGTGGKTLVTTGITIDASDRLVPITGSIAIPSIYWTFGGNKYGINHDSGFLQFIISGNQYMLMSATDKVYILERLMIKNGSSTADLALTFNADTNTGVYQSGADTMYFVTGGSDRLRITNAKVEATVPVGFPSYTVAGLPSAATAGQMIYVSNATGGAVMAFSNGTNWLRCDTSAIIT